MPHVDKQQMLASLVQQNDVAGVIRLEIILPSQEFSAATQLQMKQIADKQQGCLFSTFYPEYSSVHITCVCWSP